MDLELDKTSTKKIKVTKKKQVKKSRKRVISIPANRATYLERGLSFAIDLGLCLCYCYFFLVGEDLTVLLNPSFIGVVYGTYLFIVALPEVLFGLSPGKFVLGLRLINYTKGEGYISKCILRSLLLKFTLLLLLPLIKLINDNFTYYDKLFGIFVVRD